MIIKNSILTKIGHLNWERIHGLIDDQVEHRVRVQALYQISGKVDAPVWHTPKRQIISRINS